MLHFSPKKTVQTQVTWWNFQSIDTMKYSRDLAREKHKDTSFDKVIDQQVKDIAQTGATHVAIATPYDDEFLPVLKRWVAAARKNNLKIWFRGNWSGWEEWFEYPSITREEHLQKTHDFILKNRNIFADGDVFTACPECENGGDGDPRENGDLKGHRKFLIEEYQMTRGAFEEIGKDVTSNYDSMNGDVARLVMDRATTEALGGVVTIDHYVATPEKLASDIKSIMNNSGGRVVLGEFGAPIHDINGEMTEEEQAAWMREALERLVEINGIIGVNYWTGVGSSTALWDEDGRARQVEGVVEATFKAPVAQGLVKDEAGAFIPDVYITIGKKHFFSDSEGRYVLPTFENYGEATFSSSDFAEKTVSINPGTYQVVVLKKNHEDVLFKMRKFVQLFKVSL